MRIMRAFFEPKVRRNLAGICCSGQFLRALLLCLLFAVSAEAQSRPRERVYKGQPLSVWRQRLRSKDAKQRSQAVWVVSSLSPDKQALADEYLRLFREDPSASVRRAVAGCLSSFGPRAKPALALLRQGLASRDESMRRACVRAFAGLGSEAKTAVPFLIQLLGDSSKSVRWAAIEVLGKIGPTAVAAGPELLKQLSGTDRSAALDAALALVQIGAEEKRAVAFLVQTLSDKSPWRRWRAAQILSEIGARAGSAEAALKRAFKDSGRRVQIEAGRALWKITGRLEPSLSHFLDLLKSSDSSSFEFIFQALIEMGPKASAAAPVLKSLMTKSGVEGRAYACQAYWVMTGSSGLAVTTLTGLLSDSESMLRYEATVVLEAFGPKAKAAVPALEALAKSQTEKDQSIKDQAANTLVVVDP